VRESEESSAESSVSATHGLKGVLSISKMSPAYAKGRRKP